MKIFKYFILSASLIILLISTHSLQAQWTQGVGSVYTTTISDKVGIGTNSPNSPLHLKQSGPTGLRFERSGHDTYELLVAGARGLFVKNLTDGRDEMVFDGKGNIGIGTISPTKKLDVNGTVKISGLLTSQSISPITDNLHDLGSSSLSFRNIYFKNTIYLDGTSFIKGGSSGVYIGEQAGDNNTGFGNTFLGYLAGRENTTGFANTYVGTSAGKASNGERNVYVGWDAGISTDASEYNVYVGWRAGSHAENTHHSVFLGYNTGTSGGSTTDYHDNAMALGYNAKITTSNQVRIGNTSVTSIGGQVSWSTLSDGRFKNAIKEDVSGLDFINKLRPVSYDIDKQKLDQFLGIEQEEESINNASESFKQVSPPRQTGFIAQEVEATIKEMDYTFSGVEAPQNDLDHYSIRYAEFVVPLVKAVQELSDMIEVQNATITSQQAQINTLLSVKSISKSEFDKSLGLNNNIQLFQNHPNPFTLDTQIEMELPETVEYAQVLVYNLEGKEIKSLEINTRGRTEVQLAGGELEAGMYIYSLIVDGQVVDTKRMILTK